MLLIGLCPLQLRYLKDIKNLTGQAKRNSAPFFSHPAPTPIVKTSLFLSSILKLACCHSLAS